MAEKVMLTTQGPYVIVSNGLIQLTLLNPQGCVVSIQYGGVDNILDIKENESRRAYWDLNCSYPGGKEYQRIQGTEYSVINFKDDIAEVSFRRTYRPSGSRGHLPLSTDIRYIVRRGVSGFYCYSIYERPPGSAALDLVQTRMSFRLRQELFHYMAISDEKQRMMPTEEDLKRGKKLIVPESVLLVNPSNPDLKGEVDDKYQYSVDNKDSGVHGWMSSGPNIGFWIIFPSQEFRNGGPTKQNLTAHTGPICLAMLHGQHYIGADMVAHFEEGETWRKVFGPFFVYLNSTPDASKAHDLWVDAKKQRGLEQAAWPYDFVSSVYYLKRNERGSASGKLLVQDRFVSGSPIPAKNAYIGLSAARTEGAWQTESKACQFWAQTDGEGNFLIVDVIPGVYGLHGWVPGFVGDYLANSLVTISAGSEAKLGNLTFSPPRDGPTLWELGFADRTATGFFVPDANPIYVNKLFLNSPEKYRQYGLWDRYVDIHPTSDQVFTIGVNDPRKDWFFAHVDRKGPNGYVSTVWRTNFTLNSVANGTYKLRLAIASANRTDLQVHVNSIDSDHLVFQVSNLGADNAVCRHGIHGLYRFFSINITSSLLVKGFNTLFLTQARGGDPLCAILYDYIRLEAPAPAALADLSN